jgi:hypothetical protein
MPHISVKFYFGDRATHTKDNSFFFADIKEDRTIQGKRKPILRIAQMTRF